MIAMAALILVMAGILAWTVRERGLLLQANHAMRATLRDQEAQLGQTAEALARAEANLTEQDSRAKARLAELSARAEAKIAEATRAAEARASAAQRVRDEQLQRVKRVESELAASRQALSQAEEERDRFAHALADAELANAEYEGLQEAHLTLQSRLEQADRELLRLKRESVREPSRAFFARMQELERESGTLNEQLQLWTRRAAEAEEALARREQSPVDGAVAAERDALRDRVETLEEAMRRLSASRATLRALGLPNTPRDAQLFAAERREATEAVLRDTTIAAQAAGAAMLDPRGVQWARCGNALVIERLAASASVLAAADATPALGRPAQITSELYGVYGRHLITLNGADLRLGVTGSRECPTLALRLAALQLVGMTRGPEPAPPSPEVLELDPSRSDRLGAWAARRSALAVAVFGPGEPAGTDSVFAAACAPLHATVLALYNRARRDGFGPGFAVIWRGEDEVSLAARTLDDGVTVVFAKFNAPPAPRVLDDLVATLRWLEPSFAAAS